MAKGHNRVIERDWLWVRFPLEKMKYLILNIYFVPPLNEQYFQNSVENGDPIVLTRRVRWSR